MLESALLIISLCIDACIASFAYGTNKIKIPVISGLILTGISTLFLIISISLGSIIKGFIPANLTSFMCFGILFILGFMRLFEGLLKQYLNKKVASSRNIELTLLNFKLVLNVYADATLADIDHSKILSYKEALYLGIALSLDSLVVGFGVALAAINLLQIILLSLILNSVAIILGCTLGHRCAEKLNSDFSWLSGATLIILAFLKLF